MNAMNKAGEASMGLIRLGKIAVCVLIMLAAPLASVVAEGEPDGTWRAPPIGTKATYNYGASWEVISVEDGKMHLQGDRHSELRNISWYVYRGMVDSISLSGEKRSFDKEEVDKLFPLEVGNKITVDVSVSNKNVKFTYEVVAFKTVKTILGKRKLFKIEFTEKGSSYRANGWGFFDPEYGVWIGGDYTYNRDPVYKWRLTRLDLP